MRGTDNVTEEDLRLIIDEFEDIKEDLHTASDLKWEQVCKSANGGNVQRLILVLTRAITRKKEDGKQNRRPVRGTFTEGKDIYIRTEPIEGRVPIKKVEVERMDLIIRTRGTKSVQIENVKLLCEASGSEISALQPGGADLSPLSTPLTLKTQIEIRSWNCHRIIIWY